MHPSAAPVCLCPSATPTTPTRTSIAPRRGLRSGGLAWLAAIVALCGAAQAQPRIQPANTNGDKLPEMADKRDLRPVVELAPEAVRLESVALTFFPPTNARVQTSSVAGVATIEVFANDSTWYMYIKSPRTANDKYTTAQIADGALIDLIATNGLVFDAAAGFKGEQIKEMWQQNKIKDVGNFKGFKGLVQERNREVKFPGFPVPAEQFFVSLPGGTSAAAMMRGVTVVKVGADRYVTFELFTTEPQYERAKDIYNVLLHAATIGDPAAIAQSRADAVNAGLALMSGLTTQDMDEIVAASGERWERRFKPSPSHDPKDAAELGYRRIKAWKGKRGELNVALPSKKFNAAETEDGYLVQLDARLIENNQIIDSVARFFVSTDRVDEAWSVSLSVQNLDHTAKKAYTEIGARNDKSMTVSTSGPGNPGMVVQPIIETAGYVSRVESYLLPQILVRTKLQGEFGFYVFQSDAGAIKLRRDTLREPADLPDAWILETKLSEDTKVQTSTYRRDGVLISSQLPDGSVWEPSTQEKVVKLWRAKGLPMN